MVIESYGTEFKTTMRSCIPKIVRCDQCSLEYVYFLERSAEGTGYSYFNMNDSSALKKAKTAAQSNLFNTLLRACEPVPCPRCGHIQEHMFRRARNLRHGWMEKAAIFCVLVGLIFLVAALVATVAYREHGEADARIFAVIAWVGVGVCCLGTAFFPLCNSSRIAGSIPTRRTWKRASSAARFSP